jgi:hypothetical protein
MAMDMAMSDLDETGMADCGTCGADDGGSSLACDFVCASGAYAAIPESDAPGRRPNSAQQATRPGEIHLSGLGLPPLGHPPRLIL